MSLISDLRAALSTESTGKDASRKAGAGIWAFYTNHMEEQGAIGSLNEGAIDAAHASLLSELEELKPLEKNEKNSLTSAKCVLKKAAAAGKPVFRVGDDGLRIIEDGLYIPRGKNELQDDVPWFEGLTKKLAGIVKYAGKDEAELLTDAQRAAVAAELALLMATLGMSITAEGADDAPLF